MNKIIGLITLILLLVACGRSPSPTSEPTLDTLVATINVNTTKDELDNIVANNKCSLREAIVSANENRNVGGCTSSGSYGGTDIVKVPAGTYKITRGGFGCLNDQDCTDLDIEGNMRLEGAGSDTIIISQFSSLFFTESIRALEVSRRGTTGLNVTIKNLVLRGPSSEGIGVRNNETLSLENIIIENFKGSGIESSNNLSIVGSIIRNNQSTTSGGGIHISAGSTTIYGSTISGNQSTDGSGIYQSGSTASTTITNTTISGNSATGRGGGIRAYSGTVNITNSTITNNLSNTTEGGISRRNSVTNFSVSNTIVAGNIAPINPDCAGTFESGGNNLIGIVSPDCTGFSTMLLDKKGTPTSPLDPKVGPLADNGGPTPTHALLRGSPAIDTGLSCPVKDQRGIIRVNKDGNNDGVKTCDIGAFEYNTPFSADLRVNLDDNPGTVVAGGTFSYIMTLSNIGPDRAALAIGVLDLGSSGVIVFPTVISPLPSGCTQSGTTVTCNVGHIEPNASVTKTIRVVAPSVAPSNNLIAVVATATSSTPDPTTPNKSAEATTITNPSADLALTLNSSFNSFSILVGSAFNYTMNVSNLGPTTASNIVLSLILPSRLSFQSASPDCSVSVSTVTCTIPSLAVGSSISKTISVLATTVGSTTTNASIASATPADPNSSNNSASVGHDIFLGSTNTNVVIASPAQNLTVPRNTDLIYAVRVRNTIGPFNAESVFLSVVFPNTVSNIRVPAGCVLDGFIVNCDIGTIPFGSIVGKSITIRLPDTATSLAVSAFASQANPDPNTANNLIIRTINVQ